MPEDAALTRVFPGDSVVSALMRANDWSKTSLGPAEHWPAELTIPLGMMLTSRFEMWLGWGEDLAFFYNDAYVPTLGAKHPAAIGQPMREVWKEVFAAVEDRIVSVMRDGVATWDDALQLILERNGYPEETYHTFSYSPLRGPSGSIGGLMCVVAEVTQHVVARRRLDTLHTLATNLLAARHREDVMAGVRKTLAHNRQDFPFGFLHLCDGLETGEDGATDEERRLRDAAWPLGDDESAFRVDLAGILTEPPRGAWATPPNRALIVPVRKSAEPAASGRLVLGLNPLRPDDEGVLEFAELIVAQIAGALATVDAHYSIRKETARLQALFEQTPSFTALLRGPDFRFELVNPAFSQLIGGRDILGLSMRAALPEAEGQSVFEVIEKVYATGKPFVGVAASVSLRRKADAPLERRVLDFVYQPILSEGTVTGVFVEGIDVTEAHDAAAALKESDARFRTFAQAIPNQLWTATPGGMLTWFNDRVLEFSGLPYEKLVGTSWTDIVHPDDLEVASAAWAAALRSGEPYEVEFRLRRNDGSYRWHLGRALPVRDEEGAITLWVGTNTDIEERKQAETASLAERQRIWTSTNDLMGTAGIDGYLKAVNPAWTRLLGYSAEELLARPFFDIIVPEDHAATADTVTRLQAGQSVAEFTDRLIHKDGRRSFLSWSAEPAGDQFYIVGRDITEQRLAEDALRQSQKMEAVGQLTGGIAHDFNNLLQGITGSLDLVRKRLSQGRSGDVDRFITGAMTSANRASALTHRLLAFSRRQPLDPRPVRANPLVGSMEDLLRRTLGERVELELVLSGGLWTTLCDPNQLENAVLNLAINARDAMPDGGKLTIETCNAHLDSIYAAQARDVAPGQYVCLCVTDTGSGMSAETIARAFEPFYTTKPIGQGTGLGLSMIYGFARQSEGYAKIYSELGKGTTVKLYLPRHRGDLVADDEEVALMAPPVAHIGETVLVVEDEEVVRGLVVEVLSELGYHALEARDGTAGLDILRSNRRIDLLITDMGLPGLNGRQVADAGRSLRRGLKVLFMTGYAENAALASGFLEPGMAMITKPFAMEALAARIRSILEEA